MPHRARIMTIERPAVAVAAAIWEIPANTVLYAYYGDFPLDPPFRGLTRALHLALMKIQVERTEF